MTFEHTGDRSVYAPNSFGDSYSDQTGPVDNSFESDGELVRAAYTLREDDGDFVQPGILVREVMDDAQRAELVNTVTGALDGVAEPVLSNALEYWKNIDADTGAKIEANVRAK